MEPESDEVEFEVVPVILFDLEVVSEVVKSCGKEEGVVER